MAKKDDISLDKEKKNKKIKGRKIRMDKNIIVDEQLTQNTTNNTQYKGSGTNIVLVIIILLLVALVAALAGALFILGTTKTTTTSNGITTSTVKLEETNSIADAVSKVYDAVVVVEGYSKKQLVSTGTGFVFKKSGGKAYIMTNHHVISSCDSVKVLFTSGDELDTSLVGSDTYSDIAVLSVKDSNKITAATMGSSLKSKVGDTLFTVGSPEGADYAGTVTKGILSGKDRLVAVALSNSETSDYYMNVLQTDAAINPGNSGGPICNTNGEVIGITNMKLVDDSVEGMGFAIPIEDALEYAAMLEKSGKIERPYIGISMLDLTNSFYLWQAGIVVPNNVTEGVAIYTVESNSPAANAGLQKGDIIIKLGDDKVKTLADFRYKLYKLSPNDKVKVTYIRNGKEQTTTVTLGKSQ